MKRTTRFPDSLGVQHHAVVYYDFAVDGGAIGEIDLPGILPKDAVIQGGYIDVLTTFTTAGADAGTIAVGLNGGADLKAAIAVSDVSNPWDHDPEAVKSIVPAGTGATSIKLEVDNRVTVAIAVQAVTAGKMAIHLDYTMSPDVEIEE